MIKINLFPYQEIIKKENIKRQLIIIAGSFAIFLLTLFYVQVTVSASIERVERGIKEKEAKLQVLAKKLGDIERYKKDIKELEQKLAIIQGLESHRFFPVRLLDEFTRLVPTGNMWLEKITETGQELKIEGVARDNIVVALFMKSLEFSGLASSVNIVSSKQVDISGHKLQQFIVSCALKKG